MSLTERWQIRLVFDFLGLEGTLFLRMLQPLIRVADRGQENFSNITYLEFWRLVF
jgi:hypothetical protein